MSEENKEQCEGAKNYIPGWFYDLQNTIMEEKREKYGPLDGEGMEVGLYTELKAQLGKLRVALDTGSDDAIVRRAAHVANYAMLIAKEAGEPDAAPEDAEHSEDASIEDFGEVKGDGADQEEVKK